MRRSVKLVTAVALLGAACRAPEPPHPLAPRPVNELARWRVERADGMPLGQVALLAIDDPRGEVRMYWAENDDRQWLGYADVQGRFYRREPFADTERFVGMYPMEKGLALLYEEQLPVRIVPLEPGLAQDAAAHEASAPRTR